MTCNSQLELGIRVRSNTHTDERHYEASHSVGVWGLKTQNNTNIICTMILDMTWIIECSCTCFFGWMLDHLSLSPVNINCTCPSWPGTIIYYWSERVCVLCIAKRSGHYSHCYFSSFSLSLFFLSMCLLFSLKHFTLGSDFVHPKRWKMQKKLGLKKSIFASGKNFLF